VVLVLAVSDEVDHARYTDVGAAREAWLIACGDLPASPPSPPRRSPADPRHAR